MPKSEINFLKKNLAVILTLLTLATTFTGSIFFIEDRYANQSDLELLKKTVDADKKSVFKSFADLIKIQYEDLILDLDIKVQSGTASPFDKARLEHLKRRLQQIEQLGSL